jgi:hypothetical protein
LLNAQASADPEKPAPMIATLEGMTLFTRQSIHILGSNIVQYMQFGKILRLIRVKSASIPADQSMRTSA